MLALTFTCARCRQGHDGDEIEIASDGEQFCRACAEATGEAGAFEASIDMAAESMLPTTGDVDAGEWP